MRKPHHNNGRFLNPWLKGTKASYWGLIKWKLLSRNRFKEERKRRYAPAVEAPDFTALEKNNSDYIVWLGHSTLLIKAGSKTIITDPVFWDVNLIIKRKAPFPLPPEDLPKIDICLISHGHYDHLNTRSIKFLKVKHDPVFVTGPGYEEFFKKFGPVKHVPLDWNEEYSTGGVKIRSLPCQHWSKRTLSDTNSMLWCSFLIESGGKKYYWIGDTGYYEGFRGIGERHGPIDVLIVPIGAYEPRWFMKGAHVNPEEALLVARDVRARLVIPTHWGTFDITDEPLWMPPEKLREVHDPSKDPPVKILNHGGSYIVGEDVEGFGVGGGGGVGLAGKGS